MFDPSRGRSARYRDAPRLTQGLHLVVADIYKAREVLVSRGVEAGAVVDQGGIKYASFSDPDGNTWALQEMPTP